jgi:hypothetical protein
LRNGDDGSAAHLTKEVKPGFEAQGNIIATQLNAGQRLVGFEFFTLPCLLGLSRRQFEVHKRGHYLIHSHNESLSVVSVRVRNPDCSSLKVER